MTRVALLLVVAVLASACAATEVVPKTTPLPSATASSIPAIAPTALASTPTVPTRTSTPTRTATPSPQPIRAWDVPPKTGSADVDEIIRAMTTGDVPAVGKILAAMVQTRGCNAGPVRDSGELRCAPGVPDGSRTEVIPVISFCHPSYVTIIANGPSTSERSTLADLAARLATRPKFVWMMFELDGNWGTGTRLLFLDDRVGANGGVGFHFEGIRLTEVVTSVPGCMAGSLQGIQDLVSTNRWKLPIPPPP